MIRRTLRRLRTEQSGISLTELIVAMAMTLLIMAMVGTMFTQTARITTASNQTRNSNGVASNVADELTSVLRVAVTRAVANSTPDPAIVSGDGTSLKLYSLTNTSFSDPAPTMVTFTLNTTTLVLKEDKCTGTASGGYWTFTTCAATASRNLGNNVLAPSPTVAPLFVYYDINNNQVTSLSTVAQRASVASVVVTVTAQAAGSKTDPVIITNKVVLRNLGLDPVS